MDPTTTSPGGEGFGSIFKNLGFTSSPGERKGPRYVFWIVSIVLVAIWIAYATKKLTKIPCQNTLLAGVQRNFIHIELPHLAANLFTFWVLSRIEDRMGSAVYAGLIAALLVIFTLSEYAIGRAAIGKNPKCSIGFSGILFGLVAWELLTARTKLDWQLVLALAAMIITPSLASRKVSFTGHLLGAVCGLVLGAVTLAVQKSLNKKKQS
jgi:membrane associated rhomboid family serine protease